MDGCGISQSPCSMPEPQRLEDVMLHRRTKKSRRALETHTSTRSSNVFVLQLIVFDSAHLLAIELEACMIMSWPVLSVHLQATSIVAALLA